ncbi:hypothetical protein B566_EDAN012697 [Ephemera danica]|nr:hypothetical protein B566_EDAN012697 [Ephemera danica]
MYKFFCVEEAQVIRAPSSLPWGNSRAQLVLFAILVVFATHIVPSSQAEEMRTVTPSDLKKCILKQIERKDQLITELIDGMLGSLNETKEKIRSERQSFKCSETEYIGGYSTPQKFRLVYNDQNFQNNALAMYFMMRMSRNDVFDYDIPMLPMCSRNKSEIRNMNPKD